MDPFLAALDHATRTVISRVRGELPAATAPSIVHTYCCAPDWSLCGLDLADAPAACDGGGGEQDCVVCADLEAVACPDCADDRRLG
ncbi:hypothetical protein [Streptomyces sp. NRRL B-24572]|uniref:hypothetical protein n=1 Tax=Streptomyces sp. NRRL B-24572 TaxID=1962156 RepID=UPI000A360880|nr:hypothetical protein [Streptomyces sp. NRRL B-24572]